MTRPGLYFWRCPKCQREHLLDARPTTVESCTGSKKDVHPEVPMQLFCLTGSKP